MPVTDIATDHPVVLFDGVCNLCNGAVNFIIDRDPHGHFRFAPLQSEAGQDLLERGGMSRDTLDTMVLIEGDTAYDRSSAALRITRRLRWPWPLLFGCVVIPPVLRDLIYRFVAKNRYRWFGQSDACRVPTPEIKDRFLG